MQATSCPFFLIVFPCQCVDKEVLVSEPSLVIPSASIRLCQARPALIDPLLHLLRQCKARDFKRPLPPDIAVADGEGLVGCAGRMLDCRSTSVGETEAFSDSRE
jgi:hypothetical protein